MTGIDAIGAVQGSARAAHTTGPELFNVLPQRAETVDFPTLLAQGIDGVDAKVAHADALAAKFAVDDSVPVHQVTAALEEARLSVEFAMQVRARLVEGYKELMNLQL